LTHEGRMIDLGSFENFYAYSLARKETLARIIGARLERNERN